MVSGPLRVGLLGRNKQKRSGRQAITWKGTKKSSTAGVKSVAKAILPRLNRRGLFFCHSARPRHGAFRRTLLDARHCLRYSCAAHPPRWEGAANRNCVTIFQRESSSHLHLHCPQSRGKRKHDGAYASSSALPSRAFCFSAPRNLCSPRCRSCLANGFVARIVLHEMPRKSCTAL